MALLAVGMPTRVDFIIYYLISTPFGLVSRITASILVISKHLISTMIDFLATEGEEDAVPGHGFLLLQKAFDRPSEVLYDSRVDIPSQGPLKILLKPLRRLCHATCRDSAPLRLSSAPFEAAKHRGAHGHEHERSKASSSQRPCQPAVHGGGGGASKAAAGL